MATITYGKAAIKTLKGLPANTARTIRGKISAHAADPAAQANNVVKLQGRDDYRLRVGDWRILFAEHEGGIFVKAIRPCGGAYKE